jgi:hypothetical protein
VLVTASRYDGRDPEPSPDELGAAIEAPASGGAAAATTTSAATTPPVTDVPEDEAPEPSPRFHHRSRTDQHHGLAVDQPDDDD